MNEDINNSYIICDSFLHPDSFDFEKLVGYVVHELFGKKETCTFFNMRRKLS